ncbi:hypothetical protein JMJ56_27255 [Belnapia sp. T18]|uniref:DUF3102 domain-containing protein n=1 Tax=Belnapia arida TaxID=2804533 RepID=A0ABS1UAH9_9PROT|nr:hypothetical protein [Belnapia arida]MBL6081688.1 hypothetical protein [Belnapia arida]
MARLSPTVPKKLLADRRPPVEVMPEGDGRIEILNGALVRYERREDFAREINALWQRAQATFLTIGTYLNLAKERLPHGEFNAMIDRDLPFSPRTAFQIRAATVAIESGRLPSDRVPQNYTTIYYLSTLPDDALEQAKQSGLLRPDLRRSEVIAFKKKVLGGGEAEVERGETTARRLATLRRQKAAIEKEIARLERGVAQDC